MDRKSQQTELKIIGKDIKFVTVNMLNMNLRKVNLSENKILYLPDEIGELHDLEELKIDNNNLKKLPDTLGKI